MQYLPWKLLTGALFLGVLFDFLFFKTNALGINVLLMQIAILCITFGFTKYLKQPLSRGSIISTVFALLFAATFAIWTSDIGLALSALGILTSNIFFALFILGHHGKVHHPLHAALDGVRYLAETYITRIAIFGDFKIPVFSLKSSSVARGILITLPVIIIFAALFFGSDLILQQRAAGFTTWLNDFLNSGNIVAQLVIICFFTFVFLLFFAGAFWKRLPIDALKELTVKHNIESTIILLSINVLFFAFIVFQGVYLFGGQAAFNGIEGITYSEYAVHGFNELATIAILVILLILTLRYFHTERSMRKIVHTAELVLIAQTLLVVFSAWKRMSLYVAQYDFTPARLFGFWFFILCGMMLFLLAYHIARKIPQYKFMQQAPIVIGIAMLIFTASAPDALAVKMNIARMQNNYFDAFPLFNHLSEEAYPQMLHILTDDSVELQVVTPSEICGNSHALYSADNIYDIVSNETNYSIVSDVNDTAVGVTFFKTRWNERTDASWKTWNLHRSLTADHLNEEINMVPDRPIYSVQDIANECGLPLTDPNSNTVPAFNADAP